MQDAYTGDLTLRRSPKMRKHGSILTIMAEDNRNLASTEAALTPYPAKVSAGIPLTTLLDGIIVVLMLAILLTLSWPVCMVYYQRSRQGDIPFAPASSEQNALPHAISARRQASVRFDSSR